MNPKRDAMFSQVCVWPGTIVGVGEVDDFILWMDEEFGTRVEYLEEIKTYPDQDNVGNDIEGTGDRNDLFFAVHQDDINKFAIPRLSVGISWVEDMLNNNPHLYPERVSEYRSW